MSDPFYWQEYIAAENVSAALARMDALLTHTERIEVNALCDEFAAEMDGYELPGDKAERTRREEWPVWRALPAGARLLLLRNARLVITEPDRYTVPHTRTIDHFLPKSLNAVAYWGKLNDWKKSFAKIVRYTDQAVALYGGVVERLKTEAAARAAEKPIIPKVPAPEKPIDFGNDLVARGTAIPDQAAASSTPFPWWLLLLLGLFWA